MGLAGTGLCAFGLTREFPTSCILGTLGLALVTESIINADIDDVTRVSRQAAEMATDAAHATADTARNMAERVGLTGNARG